MGKRKGLVLAALQSLVQAGVGLGLITGGISTEQLEAVAGTVVIVLSVGQALAPSIIEMFKKEKA